jgi:hypothetical protein
MEVTNDEWIQLQQGVVNLPTPKLCCTSRCPLLIFPFFLSGALWLFLILMIVLFPLSGLFGLFPYFMFFIIVVIYAYECYYDTTWMYLRNMYDQNDFLDMINRYRLAFPSIQFSIVSSQQVGQYAVTNYRARNFKYKTSIDASPVLLEDFRKYKAICFELTCHIVPGDNRTSNEYQQFIQMNFADPGLGCCSATNKEQIVYLAQRPYALCVDRSRISSGLSLTAYMICTCLLCSIIYRIYFNSVTKATKYQFIKTVYI